MVITVEVKRNKNETHSSLIRRFSRRMQEAGVLRTVKKKRYMERNRSEFVKKKRALRRIEKKLEIDRLKRLGKIPDAPYKRK